MESATSPKCGGGFRVAPVAQRSLPASSPRALADARQGDLAVILDTDIDPGKGRRPALANPHPCNAGWRLRQAVAGDHGYAEHVLCRSCSTGVVAGTADDQAFEGLELRWADALRDEIMRHRGHEQCSCHGVLLEVLGEVGCARSLHHHGNAPARKGSEGAEEQNVKRRERQRSADTGVFVKTFRGDGRSGGIEQLLLCVDGAFRAPSGTRGVGDGGRSSRRRRPRQGDAGGLVRERREHRIGMRIIDHRLSFGVRRPVA